MHETLRPVPVGGNVIRVDSYQPMDVVHGVRLDRALWRLQEVETKLNALPLGVNKSVETTVMYPGENGDTGGKVDLHPAMHRALTNVVFNERQALHESGHGALADEIITARTGVVFEAKETREEHMARMGGD